MAWTCPTCNNTYPGDFAVCPRDATPRAEQLAAATDPLKHGCLRNRNLKPAEHSDSTGLGANPLIPPAAQSVVGKALPRSAAF